MDQDTKPAPFNVGDHVRYVAAQRRALPAGQGNETELVLAPGMEGVILLSTGAHSDQGAAAPNPWRCQIQFQNGFQLEITPDNRADFEMAHASGSPTFSQQPLATGVTIMSGKTDVVKGRLKEAAGALTGNDELRAAGKTDQAIGKVKQVAEKAIAKVEQAVKKVRE